MMGTRWVNIPETEIDENQTQCHTSDDLETINLPDEQNSQVFNDMLDSQPFFNEEETDNNDFVDNYKPMKREIEEENGSQSLISSKIRRRETLEDFSDLSTKVLGSITEDNTEDGDQINSTLNDNDTECDLKSESGDKPNTKCVECVFEKELDKRNYYFGNLLIGELQFVPPCMRSVAYMNILKYVDSLKQKHRK